MYNELTQVDIDKMTGDLKISDVELFELNSYVLSENGKKLLDKIAPIYIESIFADKELAEQQAEAKAEEIKEAKREAELAKMEAEANEVHEVEVIGEDKENEE